MLTTYQENNFSGGMNINLPPQELNPNEFVSVKNLFVYGDDQRSTLKFCGGNRTVITSGAAVQGFIRFRTAAKSFIIYAAAGHVYAYDTSALTTTSIYTAGHATNPFHFAVMSVFGHDHVFWVDGSSAIMQWDGIAVAAFSVGVTAPVAALTAAVGAAGNLDTTDLSGIQYYYTYYDGTNGIESNPSPISTAITGANFQANLTGVTVSANTRVTARNIYRIGANLSLPILVGTINDNTTTTYTDNLADNKAGVIQLNFARDLPPVGCTFLTGINSRLWMSGDPNAPFNIYYSTEGGPDYWPQGTVTDPLIDGGFRSIDGDRDNPIRAICAAGSNITVARAKGIHWIIGDNGDNYTFNPIGIPGCVATRSLVQCGNVPVWMGKDGNLYYVGSTGPSLLSGALKKYLETVTKSRLTSCCACFWRNRYVFCLPAGGGATPVCFAFDFVTRSWTDLGHHTHAGTQLYAETGEGDSDEMWIATEAGYTDVDGNAVTGIVAICTSDATPLPVSIVSGYRDYGSTGSRDIWDGVRIWGNWTPKPATVPTLTINAYSGNEVMTKSYNMNYTSGILFDRKVTKALAGNYHDWTITATISTGEFYSLEIDLRQLKQKGKRRL